MENEKLCKLSELITGCPLPYSMATWIRTVRSGKLPAVRIGKGKKGNTAIRYWVKKGDFDNYCNNILNNKGNES